ncbi:hypothetical protein FB45DRAFT_928298 [Roridomyces roridus]|uniref:Uncharacterized protein n=1 Tax=Roridomyces roridus TaxID=1738132 RepID=A0AAD7BH65_9AGAR|nr:hypothetical protein FB45DRAFT_928298 [Roridomyces roridus]
MSEPPVAFIRGTPSNSCNRPQYKSVLEPTATDSDEDLVPNNPPQQRKRRNNVQKASQPPPKRQKTSQNATTNAVASGSRAPSSHTVPRISQATSAQKVQKSRPPQTNEIPSVPFRTKVVKRTMKEKRRQRSSSSSSESVSLPSLLKNGTALPSASAPPPKQKRPEFERPTLKDRFSKTQYPRSAPPKTGREEPSTSQRKPVTSIDSSVIELSDSSDPESRKAVQRSARRKAEKRMGAPIPKAKPPEVFTIEDSDDERPTSKMTEAAPSKLAPPDNSPNPPLPDLDISNEAMDVQSNGPGSPHPEPDSHLSTPPLGEDSVLRGVSPVLPSARETFSPLENVVPGEDGLEPSLLQKDTDKGAASATLEQPDSTSSFPLPDNSLDPGGTEDALLDDYHPESVGAGQSKTPPLSAVSASRHPSPPASPSAHAVQTNLLSGGCHPGPSLPDHSQSGAGVATQPEQNSFKASDGLPRLDLSALPTKRSRKRRLPPRASTPSTGTAEKSALKPDSRPQSSSPGGSFLVSRKLKQWDQDSLVQEIITTGKHNAHVSRIGRSSPAEEMHIIPSVQRVEGLDSQLSEKTEQRDQVSAGDVQVPSTSADERMESIPRQPSPDPLPLVSPPQSPQSVAPPIILSEDPVKQEDPAYREVIDLTGSDDEQTVQSSVKAGDPRHFDRMRKLMGVVRIKPSVSTGSVADGQHPTGQPVETLNNVLPSPADDESSAATSRIPSTVSLVEGVAKMDLHGEYSSPSDVNRTPTTEVPVHGTPLVCYPSVLQLTSVQGRASNLRFRHRWRGAVTTMLRFTILNT